MNTYESLDYDPLYNQLYKKYIRKINSEAGKKCNLICLSKWTTYAFVGIIVNSAFYALSQLKSCSTLNMMLQTNLLKTTYGLGYLICVDKRIVCGIATSLVSFVEPVAAGSGIPD